MPKNQVGENLEENKKEEKVVAETPVEKNIEKPVKKKTPVKKRKEVKSAPASEPIKNGKSGKLGAKIVGAGFVILLVITVGLYIKQNVSTKNQQKELEAKIETVKEQTSAIGELKQQVEDQRQKLTEKLESAARLWGETKAKIEDQEIRAKRELNKNTKLPALCSETPVATAASSSTYPVHPRYFGLDWLGQFFTADDCDKQRRDEITAVYGNAYTLGSGVELFSDTAPTAELISAFKTIGYACAADALDTACPFWDLKTTVTSTELLKLKPFVNLLKKEICGEC